MLHQVGVSFDLYYDAREHKIKIACVLRVLLDVLTRSLLQTSLAYVVGNAANIILHTHTHTHTHTHIYMYICACMYMYIYTCVCVCV